MFLWQGSLHASPHFSFPPSPPGPTPKTWALQWLPLSYHLSSQEERVQAAEACHDFVFQPLLPSALPHTP